VKIAMVSEQANPLAGIDDADAGGQNVHVAALATALVRRGHDVRVFTRRDDPAQQDTVRTAAGFTVEHVTAGPERHVPKDQLLQHTPDFADGLADRCVRDRPDVLHAHFWTSGLASVSTAVRLGVPVVQTFHTLGMVKQRYQGVGDTSPPSRVRLEQALCSHVDLVVATSAEEVFELRRMGLSHGKAVVIPCGVDLARFTPNGPGAERRLRWRLVCVSRLIPRKGVDDVIRAVAMLPDTELLIAGGPARARLRESEDARRLLALAGRLRVDDRVLLLGTVPRNAVPRLLRSADVVVCTPWYEPFGMVALEAMACGRPVVATAVGGLVDTVAEGVTGLLVPPRQPAVTAHAVRKLLTDPFTMDTFGLAAADRAQARYGWPRIAADTERAYRQVMTEKSPAATARE
jgi:glycosyltransferase involved in cell wall biosynthesis